MIKRRLLLELQKFETLVLVSNVNCTMRVYSGATNYFNLSCVAGTSYTILIPDGVTYTITNSGITNYNAPSNVSYTAVGKSTRNVTRSYTIKKERVYIKVTGTNATVTITYNGATRWTQNCVDGTQYYHDINYGTSYTVKFGNVTDMKCSPNQYTYTAGTTSRTIVGDYAYDVEKYFDVYNKLIFSGNNSGAIYYDIIKEFTKGSTTFEVICGIESYIAGNTSELGIAPVCYNRNGEGNEPRLMINILHRHYHTNDSVSSYCAVYVEKYNSIEAADGFSAAYCKFNINSDIIFKATTTEITISQGTAIKKTQRLTDEFNDTFKPYNNQKSLRLACHYGAVYIKEVTYNGVKYKPVKRKSNNTIGLVNMSNGTLVTGTNATGNYTISVS